MLTPEDLQSIREIIRQEVRELLAKHQQAMLPAIGGMTTHLLQLLASDFSKAQQSIIRHVVGLRDELCELVSALDKLAAPDGGDEWRGDSG